MKSSACDAARQTCPFMVKICTVSAMSVVVDPSLLANIDTTKPVSSAIPVPDKENQPPARVVSLQRKHKVGTKADPPSKKRCTTVAEAQKADPQKAIEQFYDPSFYSSKSTAFVPRNTKNNEWALSNFQKWREDRSRVYPDEPCPENLLHQIPCDVEALAYWLPWYACEARNKAGEKYPPFTVYSLLCGLLRHMRSLVPNCPNFLDLKDSRFKCTQLLMPIFGAYGRKESEQMLNI